MPNQPKTPMRPIRIPDELWQQFGQLCELENTDRSAVTRQLITAWCKRKQRAPR